MARHVQQVWDVRTEVYEIPAREKSAGSLAVVLVPGNPGVVDSFYRQLLHKIYDDLSGKASIYAVGHAGHAHDCVQHENTFLCTQPHERYSLQDQIDHKVHFFSQHIIEKKIVLVGHSIGCYINLKAMQSDESLANRVVKVIHLMPTIQYLTTGFHPMVSLMVHPWGTECAANLAWALPKFLTDPLCSLLFGAHGETVSNMLKYEVAGNILYMAHTEANEVLHITPELEDIISEHHEKMTFVYAPEDPYTPPSLVEVFQQRFNFCDIQFTDKSVPHAFVLCQKSNEAVGEMVVNLSKSFLDH